MLLALSLAFALEGQIAEPGEMIAACLEGQSDASARRACIWQYANACMETREDGYSTVGMIGCISEERDAWTSRMDASRQRLEVSLDPDVTEALIASQAAWESYLQADCMVEPEFYSGGSMAGLAYTSCALDLTAERALRLKLLEETVQPF